MATQEKQVVEYSTDSGSKVKLSPSIIRRYLVDGKGNVTDQEVMMFLMLCKQQRLDPFLREAYLIKYGNDKPATLVTGKEVFTKRAERHPEFRGMHAGVVVQLPDGKLEYRRGSLVLEGEQIVGGWAKVWKAEREVPYENSVTFEEYVGRKQNGDMNRTWSSKPATMIRKVALVQTLREAFPETFSGMYDADEMNHIDSDALDEKPIDPNGGEPKNVTPAEGDGQDNTPAQPKYEDKDTADVTDDREPDLPAPKKSKSTKDDDTKGKAEVVDTINRMADKADDSFDAAANDENNLEIF